MKKKKKLAPLYSFMAQIETAFIKKQVDGTFLQAQVELKLLKFHKRKD